MLHAYGARFIPHCLTVKFFAPRHSPRLARGAAGRMPILRKSTKHATHNLTRDLFILTAPALRSSLSLLVPEGR
jgi:hypothetical protein